MSIITTEKLSKSFKSGDEQQHVLRNIDLTVETGSYTVIMGPSGSGKSTLLNMLSGMDRPTLGTVTVAGTEISRLSPDGAAKFRRRHCGFVFQQAHLVDGLSVLDNLMAVGLLTNPNRGEVRERATKLLGLVGMNQRDHRKQPSQLSGGEAQRVGMARALVNEPDVVFADEPTGQLNSENSARVLDLLTSINRDGQTVVMVTHDLRTAERGSRICYLRDGHILDELHLEPYTAPDEARTATVGDFLAKVGW